MQRAETRQAPSGAIDIVRHIFILSVIFQHMQSGNRYSPEINDLIGVVSLYIDGAVAGFFMISGYYLKIHASFQWSDMRLQAMRGFRRLIVSFLLFSIAYGLVLAALGKISMASMLQDLILLHGVGPQMYFLPYLFGIQLLTMAAVSLTDPRARIPILALSFALFFVGSLYLPIKEATGPSYWLLIFYQAAFLFGVLLAELGRAPSGRYAAPTALVIGLAILALANTSSRLFDFALAASLFCAAIALARGPWLRRRLPGSGGIYLLHTPILNYAISTVLVMAGIGGMTNLLVAFFVTYAVALTATLVLIRLFPLSRTPLLE